MSKPKEPDHESLAGMIAEYHGSPRRRECLIYGIANTASTPAEWAEALCFLTKTGNEVERAEPDARLRRTARKALVRRYPKQVDYDDLERQLIGSWLIPFFSRSWQHCLGLGDSDMRSLHELLRYTGETFYGWKEGASAPFARRWVIRREDLLGAAINCNYAPRLGVADTECQITLLFGRLVDMLRTQFPPVDDNIGPDSWLRALLSQIVRVRQLSARQIIEFPELLALCGLANRLTDIRWVSTTLLEVIARASYLNCPACA